MIVVAYTGFSRIQIGQKSEIWAIFGKNSSVPKENLAHMIPRIK